MSFRSKDEIPFSTTNVTGNNNVIIAILTISTSLPNDIDHNSELYNYFILIL